MTDSIADAVDAFLAHLTDARQASAHTLRAYRHELDGFWIDLTRFQFFQYGDLVADIGQGLVLSNIRSLLKDESRKTASRIIFLGFLISLGDGFKVAVDFLLAGRRNT